MTNILTRDARAGGLARRERPVRPGLVLAVVLIGQFMAVLDASIVNVAAPSIHASLRASGAGLQLVVAGYTITYAVVLVTGARLGDILGHRRVFLAGLVLFTLASLGCGLAGTAGLLIALRFGQGVGAALMIPQVLSLIQRTHAGPARARAMSRYSAVLAGGAVVGQLVGGLLISANLFDSGWRPVFLVNVPIGVLLLVVGVRGLPHGKGEPGRTLDLAGLALLTPAVLAFVLPLVLGQPERWPAWGWVLMAASVPLVAAFAAAERRVARSGGTPLIPGRVLRVPGVPVAIAALFTVMTIFSGFFFTLALHLQDGLGYSPLRAGLTFAPAAATFALVSLNWRRLPARWHSALIVAGDHKGRVGYGFGKANEVSEAIRKASESARKSMVSVAVQENTIPHEVIGEFGGGRVLLRPASPGTGVIAGGGVRAVVEAAGIKDVLAKSLGSSNHANVVKATIEALRGLRRRQVILRLRGKETR